MLWAFMGDYAFSRHRITNIAPPSEPTGTAIVERKLTTPNETTTQPNLRHLQTPPKLVRLLALITLPTSPPQSYYRNL